LILEAGENGPAWAPARTNVSTIPIAFQIVLIEQTAGATRRGGAHSKKGCEGKAKLCDSSTALKLLAVVLEKDMKNTVRLLSAILVLALAPTFGQAQQGSQVDQQGNPAAGQSQQGSSAQQNPSDQDRDRDKDRDKDKAENKDKDKDRDKKASVDDATLQQQVTQRLQSDASLKDIRVDVKDGVVVLEGTVPSKEERHRAKEMAKEVDGVRKVKEKVKVEANAASSAAAGTMGSTATSGMTSTTGTTGSQACNCPNSGTAQTGTSTQQPAASTASSGAQQQTGSAASSSSNASVEVTQVQNAIRNEPTLANSNVQVNVTNNTVMLNGTVPDEQTKQRAEQVARQSAPNQQIQNNIQVSSSSSASGTSGTTPAGTMNQTPGTPSSTPNNPSPNPNSPQTNPNMTPGTQPPATVPPSQQPPQNSNQLPPQ
jgi:osmotically-inducible protein OsmY